MFKKLSKNRISSPICAANALAFISFWLKCCCLISRFFRVRFAPHSTNEPGPSFLGEVNGDSMVTEGADSNHGSGDATNGSNFDDLNFLE